MITVYSGEKEVKMRKTSCRVLAFLILLGMFFVPGTVKDVAAEVNVDINIGVPPPFVLPAPPLAVAGVAAPVAGYYPVLFNRLKQTKGV